MITFIQFLITGLRLGSVYALIALGYTMVYGIIKLINFAHGDFIMVGGYSLFFIIPVMMAAGIPGWLAVVPAVLICACVGMLVELLAYRPVRKTGNNLTCLITAIAMSFVLENLAQAIPAIGPDPKVPYTLFAKTFTVGGVSVSHATVITVAVSAAIMVALYLFTQKAKVGCAMRCVSFLAAMRSRGWAMSPTTWSTTMPPISCLLPMPNSPCAMARRGNLVQR